MLSSDLQPSAHRRVSLPFTLFCQIEHHTRRFTSLDGEGEMYLPSVHVFHADADVGVRHERAVEADNVH